MTEPVSIDEPTIADRAGLYARNGWGPLPLPTGKKAMPPTGFTGTTSPLPSYADWYTVWSDGPDQWGNLGVRIPKGVVAVDVDAYDGKNGAATWKLIGGPEFPETVVLSSRFRAGYDGTSGIRFYRLPPGIDESQLWGAHDGIEILRFGHRYAVGPGSLHPNGSYYQAFDPITKTFLDVLPPVEGLAMLTVEQAGRLTVAGAPWAGEATGTERAKDDNPACRYTMSLLNRAVGNLQHKDSRYDTMSSTVWALVRGEDEGHHLGESLEILKLAYVAAAGKDRRDAGHEPPHSEFDRNLRDALRKVAANPTDPMFKSCCAADPADVPLPEDDDEDDEDDESELSTPYEREVQRQYVEMRIREDAKALLADHQGATAPPLAGISLREFLVADYGEVSYRVPGFWPAEGRVLLPAAAKTGKTTLISCNLIPSLVDGTPFLWGAAQPTPVSGTVVLFNLEVGPHIMQRWMREARITNVDKVVIVNLRGLTSSLSIASARGRKRVSAFLRDNGAEVAILDPLAPLLAALGLDENSNSDVARFFAYWSETLHDGGVKDDLISHHTGHSGERSRGASRLLDEPDAVWTLSKEKEHEERDLHGVFNPAPRYLHVFGRDVDLPQSELFFDPETRQMSLTGRSATEASRDSKHANIKAQIAALMADQSVRTAAQIRAAVTGDKPMLEAVINNLINEGRLSHAGVTQKNGEVLYRWQELP